MSSKKLVADAQVFLVSKDVILKEMEIHKLTDFSKESFGGNASFLGGVFVRFKKLLQEKSFIDGIAYYLNLKKKSADVETPVYDAFWNDYKLFDELSNYYGNQYRGSFIFNYLMGAFAVFVALVPVGFAFEHNFGHNAHHYELLFTAIELVVILTILLVYHIGAKPHGLHQSRSILGIRLNRRWHERWIEYRILAERFRYMEILYPIGINPQVEGSARKEDLGDWTNAYYAMRLDQQKIERTQDMAAYKAKLMSVMKAQSDYHYKDTHRSEHIHHRLHTFATWLFYGTLVACASHFVWHNAILTLASGFFPALAAAMHGILASGEFNTLADISNQMHGRINKLVQKLEGNANEDEIRSIAIDFHNIVIGEALKWKSMFKDKNVPLA